MLHLLKSRKIELNEGLGTRWKSQQVEKISSSMSRLSLLSHGEKECKRGVKQSKGGMEKAIAKEGELLQLHHLTDNKGSHYKFKRLGRGIGSGKGKTAGRGHKGQNSRSGGGAHPAFEGGQTPLFKRMRKYGFTNKRFQISYEEVNLSKIQEWIDLGRIDPKETITMKTLVDSKCVSNVKQGIKVLGRGAHQLKQPINIQVSAASESASNAIKEKGGQLTKMYFNRLGLQFLLKPHRFQIAPARAAAPYELRDRFDDWGQFTSPKHLKWLQYQKDVEAKRLAEEQSQLEEEQSQLEQ